MHVNWQQIMPAYSNAFNSLAPLSNDALSTGHLDHYEQMRLDNVMVEMFTSFLDGRGAEITRNILGAKDDLLDKISSTKGQDLLSLSPEVEQFGVESNCTIATLETLSRMMEPEEARRVLFDNEAEFSWDQMMADEFGDRCARTENCGCKELNRADEVSTLRKQLDAVVYFKDNLDAWRYMMLRQQNAEL